MPYDVTMPDGTVIQGVPEGTTKAQLAAKYSAHASAPAPAAAAAPDRPFKAAARGAADSASFGFGDELGAAAQAIFPIGNSHSAWSEGFGPAYQANVAKLRGDQKALEQSNPKSFLAGQVAGALVAPVAAPEKVGARLAVNGAQGLAYGAGSADGDLAARAKGAVIGAATAAAGGELGNAAVKTGGRLLAPATARVLADPALAAKYPYAGNVAELVKADVPITPGQALGGLAKWLEEVQGSIPVAGLAQKAGQAKALDGFNQGGINTALSAIGDKLPPGVKGTDAMGYMQKSFNNAYSTARQGMHFETTPEFTNDIGSVMSDAAASPVMGTDQIARLGKVQANLGKQLATQGGALTGDAYKKIISDLNSQATKLGSGNNSAADQELGHYIGQIADHIENAAKSNPNTDPAAAALMDRADKGYAFAVRLENAAKMRGGEAGTFNATQLDRAVQQGDKTARNRAYSRGDALFQKYAGAGAAVLPNKVANSGTPERAAYLGLLGGGAHFAPGIAAAGLLGALPYAPVANDVVRAALIRRTPLMLQAGQNAGKVAAPAGRIGAGLGMLSAGYPSQ